MSAQRSVITVVQSEWSNGEKMVNLPYLVKETNWCVHGDFRCEFYFVLYLLGIYTTKKKGIIKSSQSRKNQIVKKL